MGGGTYSLVTEYQLADGRETALTPLTQGRHVHTCAVYQDTDGKQVLLVTGGTGSGHLISSTEVATYTSDSTLSWRTVETGDLPTPRFFLKAAVIENVLYVSGGRNSDLDDLTTILSWDPLQEKWT